MAFLLDATRDPGKAALPLHTRLSRRAIAARRPTLSLLPGWSELWRLYSQSGDNPSPAKTFEALALDTLDIKFQLETIPSGGLPEQGPLIIAANHPTGLADGLVLVEAVRQTRRDVRIVTNHLLACMPELGESCFFVDPFGGRAAARRSYPGLRAALAWLREGRAILLFPAGEVAWRRPEAARLSDTPADSPWQLALGRLALAADAQVIPAFVGARNSRLFYAAGYLHPSLRTILLGRELLRRRGTVVPIRFGAPLAFDRRRGATTPEYVTALAREKADALARQAPLRKQEAIAPAVRADLLAKDIASLPAETLLLSSGSYDVFCADAAHIPNVLHEIGRLRELTFRSAGEGTGRPLDLDRFDGHYRHLFVWNRTRSEVVGAYRVGATDQILATLGVGGLYTSTLFRYDERLTRQISPALELGRSFVRTEYQRSHSPLLLLWKGIGELVARSPRYGTLFGAVSISSRYTGTSQTLLRAFLAHHHPSDFASLVRASNPPAPMAPPARDSSSTCHVDDLDALIKRVEENRRGIPVLLRQYLRLNARLLGFNVDPSFGDALDALMMVDLTTLPSAVLRKYLGSDNAISFQAYHAARQPTPERAA